MHSFQRWFWNNCWNTNIQSKGDKYIKLYFSKCLLSAHSSLQKFPCNFMLETHLLLAKIWFFNYVIHTVNWNIVCFRQWLWETSFCRLKCYLYMLYHSYMHAIIILRQQFHHQLQMFQQHMLFHFVFHHRLLDTHVHVQYFICCTQFLHFNRMQQPPFHLNQSNIQHQPHYEFGMCRTIYNKPKMFVKHTTI